MRMFLFMLLTIGSTAFAGEVSQVTFKKGFDGVYANASVTVQALFSTTDKSAHCLLIGILEGQINADLRRTSQNLNESLTSEQQQAIGSITNSINNALVYCGLNRGAPKPSNNLQEAAEQIRDIAKAARAERN